jgi:hypothetical protein
MNVYKLLVGIALTIILVVVAPIFANHLGLISPLADKAWLILLVTACGLIIKSIVGDVVAGEFLFYKFGYDNCVMAFGAILTALALQLVSKTDVFPGMKSVAGLKSIPNILNDDSANRCLQLFVFLLFALVGTLVTGRVASEIKAKRAKGEDFLSLFNSAVGIFLLGVYVLILVTKG